MIILILLYVYYKHGGFIIGDNQLIPKLRLSLYAYFTHKPPMMGKTAAESISILPKSFFTVISGTSGCIWGIIITRGI